MIIHFIFKWITPSALILSVLEVKSTMFSFEMRNAEKHNGTMLKKSVNTSKETYAPCFTLE